MLIESNRMANARSKGDLRRCAVAGSIETRRANAFGRLERVYYARRVDSKQQQ